MNGTDCTCGHRQVSCGCCTGGCCCRTHAAPTWGVREGICDYHHETRHTGETERHDASCPLAAKDHKVVCAWCTTTMREGIEPPSHGICATCAGRI